MIIDAHTHYLPRGTVRLRGGKGQPPGYDVRIADGRGAALFEGSAAFNGFEFEQLWSTERRLVDMDIQGVDCQVLSVPPPFGFFYQLDPSVALRICRQLNDLIAADARAGAGRFLALATVPLQDPDVAATELRRSITENGMAGVAIGTNVGGLNLDEERFRPFFAAALDLDVPVFVHSTAVLAQERWPRFYLRNTIGNPTEDAIAVASLLSSGMVRDLRGLKVYFAHGGGSAISLLGRWDHAWRVRADAHGTIEEPPSRWAREVWFDSLTHSGETLAALVARVGAARVVLGSDYPYDMSDRDPVRAVERAAGVTHADQRTILDGAAEGLFGIPAA